MQRCVSICLVSLLVLTTQFQGCTAGCPRGYVDLLAPVNSSAILKFPYHPHDNDDNMICKWRIQAPEGFVVHLKSEVSSERCPNDALTIYNITGHPSSQVTLCSAGSNHFYSQGRYMYIVLRSNASATYMGIYLQYSAVRPWAVPSSTPPSTTTPYTNSCPRWYAQLHATATNKTLTSPNYPSRYNNNAHCKWTIQAPMGYVVRLNVVDFSLEDEDTCGYDKLTINDNSTGTTLATLCGPGHDGEHFYSSGRSMNVEFRTDGSQTYRGFKLFYSALRSWEVPSTLPPSTTTTITTSYGSNSCPSRNFYLHATATIKTLTSPNYPYSYDNGAHCKWTILAPPYHVVRLEVVDFTLESQSYCHYDNLTIYDYSGTTLATLCGTGHDGEHFYSSGQYMNVEFRTDDSDTFRGFKLYYSALRPWEVPSSTPPPSTTPTTMSVFNSCPSQFLTASGTIKALTSPNYPSHYDNNELCQWTIEASWGYVVRLYIADFQLESHFSCRYDNLTIYDNSAGTTLATLCGTGHVGAYFYSSGRSMNLKFRTDDSDTFRGFKLFYYALRPWEVPSTLPPSTTTTTTSYGWTDLMASLYSDRYLVWTGDYAHHQPRNTLIKEWRITAPYGYVVHLYVQQIDISYRRTCENMKLTILDTDLYTTLGTICRYSDEGISFSSQGTKMYVRLTDETHGFSSISRNGKSFRLRYRAQREHSSSSSSDSSSSDNDFNYVVLVLGLAGGCLVISCVCIAVRVCIRTKTRGRGARTAGAGARGGAPSRSGSGPGARSRNNNPRGVFVLPSSHSPAGGHTNLAYSPGYTEDPPSYFSLQPASPGLLASSALPPSSPPHSPLPQTEPLDVNDLGALAPPSYAESMMMTHPPVGYKVGGDEDATHRAQSGVPTGASASAPPSASPPPPPPLTPSSLLPLASADPSDLQELYELVGSNPPTAPASGVAEAYEAGDGASADCPADEGDQKDQPPADDAELQVDITGPETV